jgi:glycosyltransferase involved in cell wall biosynthesis
MFLGKLKQHAQLVIDKTDARCDNIIMKDYTLQSDKSKPLVSVIVATYNMASFVTDTIDSLLNQSWPNIEVIIIDDGSTDNTAEVLQQYESDSRVILIAQPNQGQTVAKNRGLQKATGEFIGFCDADDLWRPEKLSTQLPHFTDNKKLAVVYGGFSWIDASGMQIKTPHRQGLSGKITGPLLADNFVHFPTTLTRKSVIDEFNGFDESLTMAIDYDLWLRISTKYEFLYLDDIFVDYRIWEGQMSHKTGERFKNALIMTEKFIAQNRGCLTTAEINNAWAHTYTSRAMWHFKENLVGKGFSDIFKALMHKPWDKRTFATLLRFLAGRYRGNK